MPLIFEQITPEVDSEYRLEIAQMASYRVAGPCGTSFRYCITSWQRSYFVDSNSKATSCRTFEFDGIFPNIIAHHYFEKMLSACGGLAYELVGDLGRCIARLSGDDRESSFCSAAFICGGAIRL